MAAKIDAPDVLGVLEAEPAAQPAADRRVLCDGRLWSCAHRFSDVVAWSGL